MRYYAVFDTNVLISSLLTKRTDTATAQVVDAISSGLIIPLYNQEILDMDDLVFYEVVIEKREDDAYLITGNIRHFPERDFIVTPAEMMAIIEKNK